MRLLRGDSVSYASGEVPVPGDYIKNQWEQPGTVTRVSVASNGEESVTVRWDDGGVDSPLTSNGIYSDFKVSLAPFEEHPSLNRHPQHLSR